eukprot:UN28313
MILCDAKCSYYEQKNHTKYQCYRSNFQASDPLTCIVSNNSKKGFIGNQMLPPHKSDSKEKRFDFQQFSNRSIFFSKFTII